MRPLRLGVREDHAASVLSYGPRFPNRYSAISGLFAQATALLFQLFQRSRPVILEQTAERAVGQQLTPGLALRAVVRLILGVDDALHGGPAQRAWLPVAAVYRHPFTERGHFLGKAVAGLAPQPVGPVDKRFLGGVHQPLDLIRRHSLGQ